MGFRDHFAKKNASKSSLDIVLPRTQSAEKLKTNKAISLNEKLTNINKYAFYEFMIYNSKFNN